jgi:hypothetical protein
MPRTHPFKQDEPESMRREVDEPFKNGSGKRLSRDEQRKDDHRHQLD